MASQETTIEVEEKTLKRDKPALISYIGVFALGVFLLLIGGIGILVIIWPFIHRNSILYTITNRRVKVKRGILTNKIDEIDIPHIRAIFLRQDFFATIFGYGDVVIVTAGAGTSGYDIKIKNIYKPQETLTLIKDLQKGKSVAA